MSESKGERPGVAWSWPEEQMLTYKITPTKPCAFVASNIGKQLVAIAKLLEAPDDGLRWRAMLVAAYTEADGSIVFEMAIAPKKAAVVPSDPTPPFSCCDSKEA